MLRKIIIIGFSLFLIGIFFQFSIFAVDKQTQIPHSLSKSGSNILSEQYTISIPEPIVREARGKAYYEIKNFGSNVVLGLPLLPHKKYYFEVPANAKDINVSLVQTQRRSLGIITNLGVFQGVASDTPVTYDLVAARAKYTLSTFPATIFKNLGENSIKGHRLVCVAINPLIQNLATNELTFNNSFTIKIQYTLDETQAAGQISAKKSPVFERTAKEIIYNYPKEEAVKSTAATQTVSLAPIADVPIEYAIITLPANVSAVQPLANWKTKKGVPAKVYTTTEIEAAHPEGADLQEKIRLFITNPSSNPPYNPFYSAKFDWLLIAGEQGGGMPDLPPTEGIKLPSRYVGALGHFWYTGDEDIVPADYYYADCAAGDVADTYRYDWDTGGTAGVYGELADDIRWIPDTYVGRIPSNESAKLSSVVNKIIAYEKTPTVGTWTKEAVLCGGEADGSTDGALVMDYIFNDFLYPAGLTNYRLYYLNNYPKEADLTKENFVFYVSPGRCLVQWSAHGNNIRAYYSPPLPDKSNYFLKADETSIPNGNKRSVVYAEACNNGKFDFHNTGDAVNLYYSIGDSVLFGYGSLHEWAIAFIGAARSIYYVVGWSSPSQGGSMAEKYRFNEQIYSLGKYSLGQALYDMKLDTVNYFDGNIYFDPDTDAAFRKNLFAMNLLGDPEMEIWTDTPAQFNVTYPTQVFSTGHDYTITVTDGTNPVEGARVALYKSGDAFGTGLTDVNGQIIFTVSTAATGNMDITVTKHNFVPFEAVISVVTNTPPNIPNTPNPANGVIDIGIDADISWAGGDPDPWDTVTYDVYFGINPTPGLVATGLPAESYEPGTLDYETDYYWKIVSRDSEGETREGPVWSFRTESENKPPFVPSNPAPENGAMDTFFDITLSWADGDPNPGDTVTYDVYFGTETNPPLLETDWATTSYAPATLQQGKAYYWKIVSRDSQGLTSEGPVWSFTTGICGDLDDDHFLTSLDLSELIDILFAGHPLPEPAWIADLDGDGFPTSLDLSIMIDHLFAGAPAPDCMP